MSVASFDLTGVLTESLSEGFDSIMANNGVTSHAETLKERSVAVKLSFTWFGVRKAVTDDQKSEIAETMGADEDELSVSKRLIGKHPALSALTKMRGRIKKYWTDNTLPFPEKGVRLLRKDRLAEFRYQVLNIWREELRGELCRSLDDALWDIKQERRAKLGNLYDDTDYPDTFVGKFDVDLSHPNIEVPPYLMEIDPEAYEDEKNRVLAQFQESVKLSDQWLLTRLEKMVSHLADCLQPDIDGKIKGFHQSSIDNLHTFFDQFKSLSLGSNEKLDALVAEAQAVVTGVSAKSLKRDVITRDSIQEKLESIGTRLESLIINKPKRRILRDVPVTPNGEAIDSPSDPTDDSGTLPGLN